jgi:hypothetical protein
MKRASTTPLLETAAPLNSVCETMVVVLDIMVENMVVVLDIVVLLAISPENQDGRRQ